MIHIATLMYNTSNILTLLGANWYECVCIVNFSFICLIERRRQIDVECISPVELDSSSVVSSIDEEEDIDDLKLDDETPKGKRCKGIYMAVFVIII